MKRGSVSSKRGIRKNSKTNGNLDVHVTASEHHELCGRGGNQNRPFVRNSTPRSHHALSQLRTKHRNEREIERLRSRLRERSERKSGAEEPQRDRGAAKKQAGKRAASRETIEWRPEQSYLCASLGGDAGKEGPGKGISPRR